MTEPILDPTYWKNRLQRASELHHAIFRCSLDRWKRIERSHKRILAEHINPTDRILDAGCAWGRLLGLLPTGYYREYLGIDICPDFVNKAKQTYPDRLFQVGDLATALTGIQANSFDWAVLISMRPMIIRNVGEGYWRTIEAEVSRVSNNVLYLEYDETDNGAIA